MRILVIIHANPDASIAVTKIHVKGPVSIHVLRHAVVSVLMVVQEGVGQVVTVVVADQVILQLIVLSTP